MRQLRIGVVGCGTAGAGAALFLHRDRHANLRFYALASRWMTPLFQSSGNRLATPRDLLLHRLARIGPLRRQMLLTLTGAKAGILRTLPDAELGGSRTSPPAR